jgi:hypothetical protein
MKPEPIKTPSNSYLLINKKISTSQIQAIIIEASKPVLKLLTETITSAKDSEALRLVKL